ncbi:MAG: hypothetical protein JWM74_5777 [Myxococcaceae bacterium]|nr:hypothetical protein [Myxococcaceae bacterium]
MHVLRCVLDNSGQRGQDVLLVSFGIRNPSERENTLG